MVSNRRRQLIMLGENIQILRKEKGFTQEELAARVNVVRQTISKWEKGLSVPDAAMLQKLAEVLETTVSQLLGAEIHSDKDRNELAEQLARINEQLVIKNRRVHRIWKTVGSVFLTVVVLNILFILLCVSVFQVTDSKVTTEESMEIRME